MRFCPNCRKPSLNGRIVFSLLVQDLLPVHEVTEAAYFCTTGFAAPAEAIPGPLSAMILGQGWRFRQ